jgi:hypothetical protein
MHDDGERAGSGEDVEHPRIAIVQQRPQRVIVGGKIAAVAVVRRHRVDRLLEERRQVVVVGDRKIEP